MSVALRPDPQRFPVGTTVKAYSVNPESVAARAPVGKPAGAVVSEAAVAATGVVTLELPDGHHYLCWAEVGGQSRYFNTYVPTAKERDELEAGTGIQIEDNRISATGSSTPPPETDHGNVAGAVVVDLAQPNLGLQKFTLTGNTVIELTKGAEAPEGVTLRIVQDGTGGHTWSVNLNGTAIKWVGGTSEPAYPTTKGTDILLTVVVVDKGAELLGITGLPGPQGVEGDVGPEGNKPVFHAFDSLGEKVSETGGEWAPLGCMVGDGRVKLCGLFSVGAGGVPQGGKIAQLPASAHPTFKQLIWVPNAETVTTGALFTVLKNGEIIADIEIPNGFVGTLGCAGDFPLEH